VRRAAVFAAGALLIVGCGSSKPHATVGWKGTPVVVRQPELPDDTIVSGRVTNHSGHVLKLDARSVKIVDSRGHAVRSTARFNTGITHGLYSTTRGGTNEAEPEFLRRRLGEVATVKPGASTPLVVSWRVGPGERQPVKVELGGGVSLTLPAEATAPGT
jgi:hypothetical protein